MESPSILLVALLGSLWFLFYWVFGGFFFAVMAVLRLGRVRKVRFSCLFTLLAASVGYGAAYVGLRLSDTAVTDCLARAGTKAEIVTGLFGCGFAGIFGAFLLGAAVLVAGGFLIMAISKAKNKPWIVLETNAKEEGEDRDEGFFPKARESRERS